MLGVEIEFGNNQTPSETSSYKPTKAKTPARTQGFFQFQWWPGAESTGVLRISDSSFLLSKFFFQSVPLPIPQ